MHLLLLNICHRTGLLLKYFSCFCGYLVTCSKFPISFECEINQVCQKLLSTWKPCFCVAQKGKAWHSPPEKIDPKNWTQFCSYNFSDQTIIFNSVIMFFMTGSKCHALNLSLFVILYIRYGIGERVFSLVLTFVSFVYIITIIVMVTVSDQVPISSTFYKQLLRQ